MENSTPILITGAGGFIGKNLTQRLKNCGFTDLMLYDITTGEDKLCEFTQRARLVFHLAGVNRPKSPDEFYKGNSGLTEALLQLLEKSGNKADIVITSSAQAAMDNDYGISKKLSENAVRAYAARCGAKAFIYRLPGVFGKWCRPNYNSVVATFCHNIANGLPVEVRDASYTFPLVYIDDVVSCLISATDKYSTGGECAVSPVYTVSLGELAGLVESFKQSRTSLSVPDMGSDFCKKLYSAYLSYIPDNNFSYKLKMNCDERGSFTEFLRTQNAGQVSVNISRPGVVKGNHWHDTKNEKFLVVRGEGVIRFRQIHSDKTVEYRVSGNELEVVDIPTGYTHNIENTGNCDMITVMWANEPFNPENPDTYFLKV